MSINHLTLWTKLGQFISKANSLETLGNTTLPADLQEIVSTFGTTLTGVSSSQSPLEGLHSRYLELMSAVASMRQTIEQFADATALDYDTILRQLPGVSAPDLTYVLSRLIEDMEDNNQTVAQGTVTVGPLTPNPRNVGNGTILLGTTLDGFNSPVRNSLAHPRYNKKASNMAPPNITHYFVCSSGSYGSGNNANNQAFRWQDATEFNHPTSLPEGIGEGPSLTNAQQLSLLSNGSFTTASVNTTTGNATFTGWNIVSGNSLVRHDTGNSYDQTGALALAGDGATTVELNQNLQGLSPLRRYALTLRLRKLHTTPTQGTITLFVHGDNYSTATGDESITRELTSLSSEWQLLHVFFNTPRNTPNTSTLTIRLFNNPTPGSVTLVDDITLSPVQYHGGVHATLVAGKIPFAQKDSFTCTVTAQEKLLQQFARRHWKIQLPHAPTNEPSSFGALGLPFTLHTTSSFGGALTPFALFTTNTNPTIPDSLGA